MTDFYVPAADLEHVVGERSRFLSSLPDPDSAPPEGYENAFFEDVERELEDLAQWQHYWEEEQRWEERQRWESSNEF